MKKFEPSKYIFIALLFGFVFGLGMYSAAKQNPVYEFSVSVADTVRGALKLVWVEKSNTAKTHPIHFLQRARYKGSEVVINDVQNGKDDLILLSGFFNDGNELRLIRRDGEIVRRWPVAFSEHFPNPSHMDKPPETDWNIDMHGALALPDGSVLFNYENGGLVKLDRCGKVVWKLGRMTHHSIEPAEGGGFWVPGRIYHTSDVTSSYPPFTTPFYEDTILKVSEEGKVLHEISVPGLIYDNRLDTLLTATGKFFSSDNEIVHLNKVGELYSSLADDFPMFASGDLILSLRNYNMLLVIDPKLEKIKWWQIGPWIRQHDPEFRPGGVITIFNNNMYHSYHNFKERINEVFGSPPSLFATIDEFNPVEGEIRVLFGDDTDRPMLSSLRGKHDFTPEGHLFITAFEDGRVLEVDADGNIIWEFINRYNENAVAEITEAKLYPKDYFTISDWTCN